MSDYAGLVLTVHKDAIVPVMEKLNSIGYAPVISSIAPQPSGQEAVEYWANEIAAELMHGLESFTVKGDQYENLGTVLTPVVERMLAPSPTVVGGEASKCATCNGHGIIGGPSYYSPDEGGVDCPDCPPIVEAETVRDAGQLKQLKEILEWDGIEYHSQGMGCGLEDAASLTDMKQWLTGGMKQWIDFTMKSSRRLLSLSTQPSPPHRVSSNQTHLNIC